MKKTKAEINKKPGESIMSDKNANTDIEELPRKVQNSKEAAEVVKEMEKIIKSNKCNILLLAYQQGKTFKKFKGNDKFINLVNQFGVSKSTMFFKIVIVRFLNNYHILKKSSLSLPFLKNNFKIIKDICRENSSEFE